MTQGKEVTTVAMDQALAAEIGELSKDVGGLVKVRQELLKVARIKVGQKQSGSIESGLSKLGDFSCDVRSKNFGPVIEIIPILVSESAAFIDNDTSRLICKTDNLIQSTDGHECRLCPYGEYWSDWGTKEKKKKPKCSISLDVTCLIVSDDEMRPMEINFRKNNYKAGRAIINFIANDPRKVPFGCAYTLRTVEGKKDQYTFHYINEKRVEMRTLTNEEIAKILPTVKMVVAMEKAGSVEREQEERDAVEDDLPI